jgi:hypothetical protein
MSANSVPGIASVQQVSAISSDSRTPEQVSLSARRAEMHQLQEALQSRDLNAAQQAYDRLSALSSLNAIGAALRTQNLDAAQQALTALQSTYPHEILPAATASAPHFAPVSASPTSSAASAPPGIPEPASTTATTLPDQNPLSGVQATAAPEVAPSVGAESSGRPAHEVNLLA